MPSFDVVSEVDHHELANAVDQSNREVTTRFDFKGSNAQYELNDLVVQLSAEADFQLKQMREILYLKASKRGIDVSCLEVGDATIMAKTATQSIKVREGIDTPLAKSIVKLIKQQKLKVQGSIQGDQVRITGKKRDDLQNCIATLKQQDYELPLQFKNFRD